MPPRVEYFTAFVEEYRRELKLLITEIVTSADYFPVEEQRSQQNWGEAIQGHCKKQDDEARQLRAHTVQALLSRWDGFPSAAV